MRKREAPAVSHVNVAALTPRRAQSVEIDLGAMLELVDYVGSYPVAGLTLFGTTGEFVHFTIEERVRFANLLAKRSKVPVGVNVSHSTLDGALAMAEDAAAAGIAAVLIMPPHYFRYSPAALESFFSRFAERIARWVPVYLYNAPAFTDPIPMETIERLVRGGLVTGVKDSSAGWTTMEQLLALRRAHPFQVVAGNDRTFTRARTCGADSSSTGLGCVVPELMLALDAAITAGRTADIIRLDARVQEFIDEVALFPAPAGLRAALEVRGLKVGPHAVEFGHEIAGKVDAFRSRFRNWLSGVLAECR